MKKVLWAVAAVLVVLVVAVLAAPFVIPVDTYKDEVRKQVQRATGRELTVAGDVDLSILPRTQLTVADVAFANADWAEAPQMAELERLRVRVNPLALLSGNLEIESFVLEKPVIHLAVNAAGTPNWAFAGAGGDGGAGTGAAGDGGAGTAAPAADRGLPVEDVRVQDVRLVDGRVIYADMGTGRRYELSDVNLTLALETLDAPFGAEGSVVWNAETIDVALDAGPPRKLMAGEPTDLALTVESQPVSLSYDGSVTNAQPRKLEGGVEVTIPSVKAMARWAGSPIAAGEGALEAFKLKGQLTGQGDTYAVSADTLRLDDITGSGAVGLDLTGDKPYLNGRLDLARLDLTPYLPAPTEPAEDAGKKASKTSDGSADTANGDTGAGDGAAKPSAPRRWSDEAIDVSALHALDADFELTVEGIQAREVRIGKSALTLELEGGRLKSELRELNLYDGQGSGTLVVDARGETPAVQKSLTLKGVNLHPLLRDAAGFERLEGQGALSFEIAAKGRSQKAMVEALDGKGAFDFRDGAVVGINLAAMVRNVASAFTGGGGTQKTDFAELSGTFNITDGILENDDLVMLNPLLRVTGAGTADIPKRTVDYRLTPKAVASIEGQESEFEKKGLAVPVTIEGPWHDLRYRPDLESLVRDVAKDPEKLKESVEETVEGLKEGGGEGVKGILDQLKGEGGESDTGDDPAAKAEEAIKKLFGD